MAIGSCVFQVGYRPQYGHGAQSQPLYIPAVIKHGELIVGISRRSAFCCSCRKPFMIRYPTNRASVCCF
jgi:hypothetical protein